MDESIIKILKPIPKVQLKPSESELQLSSTQPKETSLPKELLCPESELIDMAEPISMRVANTGHSGWKVSDILREIRLDSFGMGSVD